MDDKNRDFPQYRKLVNGRRYYKITSDKHFEEKQLIGSNVHRFQIEAKQYPEMVYIMDLLDSNNEQIVPVSEEEYEAI